MSGHLLQHVLLSYEYINVLTGKQVVRLENTFGTTPRLRK